MKLFADLPAPKMDLPIDYDSATPTQRRMAREEYERRQHYCCAHCNQPLNGEPREPERSQWIDPRAFPPGFFNHPVHLHHSRETGKTIGAVHARCNAWLWQYRGE